MNRSRKKSRSPDPTSLNWRESPPGPAQKELNRLFVNGLIKDNETPNTVRQRYPLFMQYSARVFAVHFRKTKSKLGLCLGRFAF